MTPSPHPPPPSPTGVLHIKVHHAIALGSGLALVVATVSTEIFENTIMVFRPLKSGPGHLQEESLLTQSVEGWAAPNYYTLVQSCPPPVPASLKSV